MICSIYLIFGVVLTQQLHGQNLTDRPQVARRIFLETVKSKLGDLKIIQARLKRWQKRLLLQKIVEAGQPANRDAKLVEMVRRTDQNHVEFGVEGADAINQPISDLMFQSDMMLDLKQVESLSDNSTQKRSKRQAQTGPSFPHNQWPTGSPISFYFDSSIAPDTRRLIRSAIRHWQENTCLKFQENGQTQPKIKFFKGGGCYSQVGRDYGAYEQIISIGRGCEQFGIITHELAHTLGYFHGQARHDRDSYINVIYPNLTPQLIKHALCRFGSGKSNCVRRCPKSSITCMNGGFYSPSNCSRCICPAGFGGDSCTQLQQGEFGADQNCGQIIQATTAYQTLSNRVEAIPGKNLADRHAACYWHIKAPKGQRVQMKILQVYGACSTGCFYSGLEIKIGNFIMTGARICCKSDLANMGWLESESNMAIVYAYSSFRSFGFKLKFRAVGEPQEACEDKQKNCENLVHLCSHQRYYKLMSSNCAKTCERCSSTVETPVTPIRNIEPELDEPEAPECGEKKECKDWKANGFCDSNFFTEKLKKQYCGLSCKLCKP